MSLADFLAKNGRFPPVQLIINPIDKDRKPIRFPIYTRGPLQTGGFTEYSYDSNILIPVDQFHFSFKPPEEKTLKQLIRDGDVSQIIANNVICSTGIVDSTELDINAEKEVATIRGRDMLSQFEDQTSINEKDRPIWANSIALRSAVNSLCVNTRINPANIIMQSAPKGSYFFPTEPGESKLTSILRFLEPLNCLIWTNPLGQIVVGRPNFNQQSSGDIYAIKSQRKSNLLGCSVVRNATQIPNVIVPIWAGQELAQNAVAPQSRVYNTASRPQELLRSGHRVPKTVVVSHPQGFDANFINALEVSNRQQRFKTVDEVTSNNPQATGTFLQQWAKRAMARANMGELLVDIKVPGHYNDAGNPFRVDTVYKINIERADVNQKMYLYGVRFNGDQEEGQTTNLSFCNLGTIVADTRAP